MGVLITRGFPVSNFPSGYLLNSLLLLHLRSKDSPRAILLLPVISDQFQKKGCAPWPTIKSLDTKFGKKLLSGKFGKRKLVFTDYRIQQLGTMYSRASTPTIYFRRDGKPVTRSPPS